MIFSVGPLTLYYKLHEAFPIYLDFQHLCMRNNAQACRIAGRKKQEMAARGELQ